MLQMQRQYGALSLIFARKGAWVTEVWGGMILRPAKRPARGVADMSKYFRRTAIFGYNISQKGGLFPIWRQKPCSDHKNGEKAFLIRVFI
jgi:hypothetical protein